ncbi:potassium channel family protein [Achromobacter insuavis]|uniref:potassium channel family protein n=1 Tax=Achromobacter insuavis TaxID=1287735 RepID=UPI0024028CC6|nr:potassium channel family protein [Achromobacter insuavis]
MLSRKIESLKISWLVCALAFITLGTALGIFFLSPCGHGITPTTDSPKEISLWDALYFSVVTISSLGYGDYRPVGYGRILATAEVVLGLVLIALIVSKLASDRTSTYVRLLYTSDSERRLKEFKSDIQKRLQGLQSAHRNHDHKSKLGEIRGLGLIAVNLAKYYQYQVRVGALGEDWAKKNSLRIAQSIIRSAEEVGLVGKAAVTSLAEHQQIDTTFRHMEHALKAITSTHSSNDFESSKQQLLRTIESYRRYIAEGRTKPTYSEVTPFVLGQVKQTLPPKPWPKNVHKVVAQELRISNKLAHKTISILEGPP